MQRLGLLGWPATYSVSPEMHNAGFRARGLAARYELVPVPPADLAAAVAALRGPGWLGANVTIPHKEAVIPLVDELDPAAALIGAVNTVARRGDLLVGCNTDWEGFLAHLRAEGVDPAGLRAVVLGAGGAARAVAVALARGGVSRLTVLNRTPGRAEPVAAAAAAARPGLAAAAGPLAGPDARRVLSQADLVVNCTPLGMAGHEGESPLDGCMDALPGTAFVYDTVYRPVETRLLREARARGLRCAGGLGMLVFQGALAWRYWFGAEGPVAVMWEAARAALGDPAAPPPPPALP